MAPSYPVLLPRGYSLQLGFLNALFLSVPSTRGGVLGACQAAPEAKAVGTGPWLVGSPLAFSGFFGPPPHTHTSLLLFLLFFAPFLRRQGQQ